MKRLVRTCIAILTALTISQTAFAATGELLGDGSKGNHPDAPYAASEIIVPRPSQSAACHYTPMGKCLWIFRDIGQKMPFEISCNVDIYQAVEGIFIPIHLLRMVILQRLQHTLA